jgi:hypothetical protein
MEPGNPDKLMFAKYVCAQTRFQLTRERYGNKNTVVMTTQWHGMAAFFNQKSTLFQWSPLTLVNAEQTDNLQRQLQNLKREMDDLKGKLIVEQDNLNRATDEKHRAEELMVCPPVRNMPTIGNN